MTTNEKMDILRQKLNSMIADENVNKEELQKVSEELDVIIVQSIREKRKNQEYEENHSIVDEVEKVLNQLQLFKKMYQSLRIVDPVNKKVLSLKNKELHDEGILCHEFWKRKQVCDNCISIKAYRQNDTIIKFEIKNNSIYMIMAVPIIIGGTMLVLEMFKNTTDTAFMVNGEENHEKKLYAMIEYLNQFSQNHT